MFRDRKNRVPNLLRCKRRLTRSSTFKAETAAELDALLLSILNKAFEGEL
jgi:hypothetical protein